MQCYRLLAMLAPTVTVAAASLGPPAVILLAPRPLLARAEDLPEPADPTSAEAWYLQGTVLSQLGRHEEAIASYDRALEIKPDFQEAWDARGDALNG